MARSTWTSEELGVATRAGRLGPTPLLHGLSIEDLRILRSEMTLVTYPPDRVLQLAGSVPRHCWLITDGFCKTVIPTPFGGEVIGMFAGPGDLVGPVLASQRPAVDSLLTITDVRALATSVSELRLATTLSRGIMEGVVRVLADREEHRSDRILRTTVPDASWRVRSAIVDLARRWSTETLTGTRISIPLSQEELGAWVGLSRESVAKILRELRQRGLVTTGRRELVVQDVAALASGTRYAMSA